MTNQIEERLGNVTLTPADQVVAGSTGQWTLVYTAGSYGVDDAEGFKKHVYDVDDQQKKGCWREKRENNGPEPSPEMCTVYCRRFNNTSWYGL